METQLPSRSFGFSKQKGPRKKKKSKRVSSQTYNHDEAGAREKLIQASVELFAKQGYNGTSVKEISDRAGVNISLVSYYFQGKQNLYLACIDLYGKEMLAMSKRLLEVPESVEELRVRLTLFIQELIESYLKQPELTQIIFRDMELEDGMTDSVFRERFLAAFQVSVEFFKGAKKNGLIRKDLDPELIAQAVCGKVVHAIRTNHLREKFFGFSLSDSKYRKKVIQHFCTFTIDGVIQSSGA